MRRDRHHAKEHDIDDAVAADQQLGRVRHGAEIGGDVDGVGDEQQRHHDVEQRGRIVPADIAGDAVPGDAADPRGDFLDRRHQRKGQQHGPADAVAELRAGLAVGADPRRIVVGRAGDQAGPERLCGIAEAKRLMRFGLRRRLLVAGILVRVMLRTRLVAICHTRVQPPRQRTRAGFGSGGRTCVRSRHRRTFLASEPKLLPQRAASPDRCRAPPE